MFRKHFFLVVCLLSHVIGTKGLLAQQIALPKIPADVPRAPAGTAMSEAYVQAVGRMAYLWGYTLVNSHNRRAGFAYITGKHGDVAGLNGGVVPMAPVNHAAMLTDYVDPAQTFVTCPNQDVVYGAGYYALDKEPVVFQVPDFGDRFWIYALYDARTDQFAEIGKPYGTKPGFYLMVGPRWEGTVPPGINALVRSSTELAFSIPRIFKGDSVEETEAVQTLINQVAFYPLSQFDGKMKVHDWRSLPRWPTPPGIVGETKWVVPEAFYEQLPEVMKLVPPLPGEEALYAWIESVWEAAESNPSIKKALIQSFVAADQDTVEQFFRWDQNGKPAGNGWNSPVNNAQWGYDFLNRTATGKSNMYDNRPTETKYLYRDLDSQGRQLQGRYNYMVTFAKDQEPPVQGFWSLTVYNDRHVFHPNPMKRYSLGTKSKSFIKYNPDGTLTLYFGAKSPGPDKEANWVPAPEGNFSLYIRAYWADQAVINGTWMPPNVERID